jgi:hypothetical protein
MADQINHEQVARDASNFIATFISLGDMFRVTDDTNRYIMQKDIEHEGQWVQPVLTINKATRPLAIYGTQARDVCVINPFADGISATSEDNWFYKTVNEIFSSYLIAVMKHILVRIVAQKDKKNYEKMKGDDVCGDYVGEYASKINKITINEFNGLIKNPYEFFKVYVSIRKGTAEVRCKIFNDEDRKYLTNIRKSTWGALETIITSLLKTNDAFSDFEWKIESKHIPKLEAMANILGELYTRLQEPAERLLGVKFDGLDVFLKHLPNLETYYNEAHWCVTSSAPVTVNNVSTAVMGSSLPAYSVGQADAAPVHPQYQQSISNYGYGREPVALRSTLPSYNI